MDLAVIRIYGSIAIILGCFIFLYPKLMHPLVMTLFGMNTKNTEPRTPDVNDLPPYLRDKTKMAESKSAGVRDDLPDHIRRMRSGPHPGMRAAAAEQSRQQTKGSGKGMMGVILPMYAVGIVVYLVYTLFKVFNKKDDKDKNRRSPSRNVGQSSDTYEEMGDNSADEGRVSGRTNDLVTPQDLQNELQSLVARVQDKNLTEMDMRKLQERLAETEAQMTKILAAMQAVQGKVDMAATSQGQGQTGSQDTSNNQSSESTQQIPDESIKQKSDRSTESSPGSSESYEIINKPEKDESKTDVETIQSNTVPDDSSQLQDIDDDDDEVGEEEEEEEDILMEDKKTEEEADKHVTVRQRITKKEETDS